MPGIAFAQMNIGAIQKKAGQPIRELPQQHELHDKIRGDSVFRVFDPILHGSQRYMESVGHVVLCHTVAAAELIEGIAECLWKLFLVFQFRLKLVQPITIDLIVKVKPGSGNVISIVIHPAVDIFFQTALLILADKAQTAAVDIHVGFRRQTWMAIRMIDILWGVPHHVTIRIDEFP